MKIEINIRKVRQKQQAKILTELSKEKKKSCHEILSKRKGKQEMKREEEPKEITTEGKEIIQ